MPYAISASGLGGGQYAVPERRERGQVSFDRCAAERAVFHSADFSSAPFFWKDRDLGGTAICLSAGRRGGSADYGIFFPHVEKETERMRAVTDGSVKCMNNFLENGNAKAEMTISMLEALEHGEHRYNRFWF